MELHPNDHTKFKCQWFDPQEDPRDDKFFKCGEPAKHEIKVHGGVTKAFVFLCDFHKAQVNDEFARRRSSGEVARPERSAAVTVRVDSAQHLAERDQQRRLGNTG